MPPSSWRRSDSDTRSSSATRWAEVALGLAIRRPDVLSEHVAGLVLINSSARGPADRAITRAKAAALDWAVVERLSRDPRHGIVFARKNFGVDARRSHVEPPTPSASTARCAGGGALLVDCSGSI